MWNLLTFKLNVLLCLQMDLLLPVPEPSTSSWLTSLPCLPAPPALGFPVCPSASLPHPRFFTSMLPLSADSCVLFPLLLFGANSIFEVLESWNMLGSSSQASKYSRKGRHFQSENFHYIYYIHYICLEFFPILPEAIMFFKNSGSN